MSTRTGDTTTRRAYRRSISGACIVAILFVPTLLHAASVSSEVSPSTVEVGETVNFQIEITAQRGKQLGLARQPAFGDAFGLRGRTRSARPIRQDGKMLRSLTLVYRLQARREGVHELDPPVVQIGDAEHRPSPQTVRVRGRGGDDSSARKKRRSRNQNTRKRNEREDVFVDYYLEPNAEPYLGQQLTLRYSLFTARTHTGLRPKPPQEPSLDSFWIEDLSREHEGDSEMTKVDGRFMKRTTLRLYALFPLETGSTTIEPLSLEVHSGGLFTRGQSTELESEPVELEVRPLPDGAPDDFYEGNVGDWSFRLTPNSRQSRVGDAFTVELRASGTGNPRRLELPSLDDIDGFRVIDRTTDVETEFRGLNLTGTKTVEVDLMPTREGTVTLPEISFAYFDPDEEEYRTDRSDAVEISVEPGSLPDDSSEDSETGGNSDDEPTGDDLRARLPGPVSSGQKLAPTVGHPLESRWFWFSVLPPAGGLLMLWLVPFVRRLRDRSGDSGSTSPPRERAEEILDDANSSDSDAAARAIERALGIVLAEKYDVDLTGASASQLRDEIEAAGFDVETADGLAQLRDWCEETRYAPGETTGGRSVSTALDDARSLLESLAGKSTDASSSASVTALLAGLLTLCVLAPSSTPGFAEEEAESVTFGEALEAHQSGEWDAAVDHWRRLAEREPHRAAVQTNLGIAAAHAERLGLARLALERARLLAPNADVVDDALTVVGEMIAVARGNASGTSSPATGGSLGTWRLATSYPVEYAALALVLAIWILFLGMSERLLRRTPKTRLAASLIVGLGAVGLVAATAAWSCSSFVRQSVRPVVVTDQPTSMRTGPSEHAPALSGLGAPVAGTLFPARESRGDWTKIRTDTSRDGWLPTSSTEPITVSSPK